MKIKRNIFVNLSNHPSQKWCQEQTAAVDRIVPDAQIVDYPFPSVDSSLNETQILRLADQLADEIAELEPSAVMCQGEFGLTFCLVSILKRNGIKVVYSCSERRTTEHQTDRGTEKISTFMFAKFREY